MSIDRILVWVDDSDPSNPISFKDEVGVFEALHSSGVVDVEVEVEVNQPTRVMQGRWSSFNPDLVHFIGHGSPRNGSLILRDDYGLPQELDAKHLRQSMLAGRDGGPRAVVLNACHSGQSAPHLVPPGGWLVALNRAVFDDAAAAFTREFYGFLLRHKFDPDEALRRAAAELVSLGFSDSDLVQKLWQDKGYGFRVSRRPPVTDDYRGAIVMIGRAFDRGVFRVPAINEASTADMKQALNQAASAVGTGQLYTRDNPSVPYDAIAPHLLNLVGVAELRRAVAPLLDRVSGVLTRIAAAFPASRQENFHFVLNNLEHRGDREGADQFLGLLDDLDRARSAVLKTVSKKLVEVGEPPLPPIELSSVARRHP